MSRPKDEAVVERAIQAHMLQIDRQADHVLLAFQTMYDQLGVLSNENASIEEREPARHRFWLNAHAALTAAAIISKTFWPARKKHEWRGDELRQRFGVADDSPLNDRTVRDSYDHIDERLDTWAQTPGRVIYVGSLIGPEGTFDHLAGEAVPHAKRLRAYDPMTHTLYFAGDSVHLPTLVHAVEDIRSRITGESPWRIVPTTLMRGGKPVADGTNTAQGSTPDGL